MTLIIHRTAESDRLGWIELREPNGIIRASVHTERPFQPVGEREVNIAATIARALAEPETAALLG